jgi:hypothetical protein
MFFRKKTYVDHVLELVPHGVNDKLFHANKNFIKSVMLRLGFTNHQLSLVYMYMVRLKTKRKYTLPEFVELFVASVYLVYKLTEDQAQTLSSMAAILEVPTLVLVDIEIRTLTALEFDFISVQEITKTIDGVQEYLFG